jgi:hypothetical protein
VLFVIRSRPLTPAEGKVIDQGLSALASIYTYCMYIQKEREVERGSEAGMEAGRRR